MTDTMIEKAAEALWAARTSHFGLPVTPLPKDERHELYVSYVRAVLSAIREPDEAMVERVKRVLCQRGCSSMRRDGKCATYDGQCVIDSAQTETARLVIDAILAEKPK